MLSVNATLAFNREFPALTRLANAYFRHLNHSERENCVQNCLCLTWAAFRRACKQGKTVALKSILYYSARQTRSGRSITGCPKATCAMDQRSRKTTFETFDPNYFLAKTTGVPEIVSFKNDIPDFLEKLSDRDKKLFECMATGQSNSYIAKRFRISHGRVSQLRRKNHSELSAYLEL